MSTLSVAAVGIGAMFGAWTRWGLGALLNPLFPLLPLGTLCANLVGSFCIGVMMVSLLDHAGLRPELVLMITTGFLGSLTTFSAFSAETDVAFFTTGLWMVCPSYLLSCRRILDHDRDRHVDFENASFVSRVP